MAVCMWCVMECGVECGVGDQAGQAFGKALESNSTLQSLDLNGELGGVVGQGRGMHLRGMEMGPTTCMEQAGPCGCTCKNAWQDGIHMWVLGDVQCAMGYERGQGKHCTPW